MSFLYKLYKCTSWMDSLLLNFFSRVSSSPSTFPSLSSFYLLLKHTECNFLMINPQTRTDITTVCTDSQAARALTLTRWCHTQKKDDKTVRIRCSCKKKRAKGEHRLVLTAEYLNEKGGRRESGSSVSSSIFWSWRWSKCLDYGEDGEKVGEGGGGWWCFPHGPPL